MKEIRFRAWDTDMERMCKPFDLDWFKDDVPIPDDWTRGALFSETSIFMQYTGLEDKNGVEIYEGDYINITEDDGRSYGHGNITFHRGGFQCHDMHIQDIYYENLVVEVIGNIYENPELLEKEYSESSN